MKARHLALVSLGFRLGRTRVDRAAAQRAFDRLALDRRIENRIPGWRWKAAAAVRRNAARLADGIDVDGPPLEVRRLVVSELAKP